MEQEKNLDRYSEKVGYNKLEFIPERGEKLTIDEILDNCPKDKVIVENIIKTYSKINSILYKNIMCSISGGADSDIVIDICKKCDNENKIKYVWFDTGLEYEATKEHLKYLEEKYSVEIHPYKTIKPVPTCCKEFGQPFLSKQASEMISRLQRHNFKWEDKPFADLLKEYPKCKAALRWWCNNWGEKSKFNISYNNHLKEFMIENPPQFKISNLCCHYAKKEVARLAKNDMNCDLSIVGVRKAEGGARSTAYKSCFSPNEDKADEYRPIFYYKESNKALYEEHYDIVHSKCYTEYGLKRTGCAGCPFGRDFEGELQIILDYEPKLYVAINNIFQESYEYTRKYRQFCREAKQLN